jgi:hypothetical protein
MFPNCNNSVKAHPEMTVCCKRLALDFLLEAARKANLMRRQVATCGKLQESNLDPSVSVALLRALVGSHGRLVQPSPHNTPSRCRHFLTELRGKKQLKSRAAGSPTEAKGEIRPVCARVLTVCKKPASRARGLLGVPPGVVARLLPDRSDLLMPHHRFQGAICK